MQSSLELLEEKGIIADVLVMLEPTFPFRDESMIDQLIYQYVEGGFDTVIPARTEYNSCWMEGDGSYRRIDAGYIARQFKTPFYTGLKGLCCVCSPATVRNGRLFGENVGLFKLEETISAIEVRSESDDREYARLRVHADDVADEEVAGPVLLLTLLHDHAHVKRVAKQLLVFRGQRLVELGEDLGGTTSVELAEDVLFGPGHEQRVSYRTATLRHDRVHDDVAA